MNICVVGAGYVGLVGAAGFADMGYYVTSVESDPARLEILLRGGCPIHEPGLEPLIASNVKGGRLVFVASLAEAKDPEVIFLAVGTPPRSDGSADMSYVHAAARDVGQALDRYAAIVTKSTVPVGTAERVRAIIAETLAARGVAVEFDVASNPEFLKEGSAVKDFMNPDRIILGVDSPRAEALLRRVYAPFMRNHDRTIVMRPREAELTKYAANAMLATKISFMNEISELCDELEVDIERVRIGLGADARIGYSFMYAGCGYGGSCFPKDVKALIHTAKSKGTRPGILEAVEDRNARQKRRLFDKVVQRFGKNLTGRTFAVWGLAFKPDTDDVREASSLTTIELLLEAGARVRAYDPIAGENARRALGERRLASEQLAFCPDEYEAVCGADALLLVTEWKQFRNPDFARIKEGLKTPIVFDGRNQYDPAGLASLGFECYGIGRGTARVEAKPR